LNIHCLAIQIKFWAL